MSGNAEIVRGYLRGRYATADVWDLSTRSPATTFAPSMTLSRRATVTPVVKLRQTGAVKRGGHKPPTCEDGRWRFAGADYKREATKWRCPTGECKPASRWVAKHGRDDSVPARVRIRAVVLRDAIDDFAATISTRFHGARSETTEASLEAYTRDHG